MILDKRSFKIDKANAMAMISGYVNNNEKTHQAIWCDVIRKPFPMLITLNRTTTKFPMSRVGNSLNTDNYSIPLKYIAIFDSEYSIRNDMKLWEKICTNGLFDIWDPYAPYRRFAESKADEKQYRIQIIRVWEIENQFYDSDIRHASDRIDHISKENRTVSLKSPVINDEEFKNIKMLLAESIAPFRTQNFYFSRKY
jgi:hypothetical protein